jgi:Leucine-rich repeat (LRR) protein
MLSKVTEQSTHSLHSLSVFLQDPSPIGNIFREWIFPFTPEVCSVVCRTWYHTNKHQLRQLRTRLNDSKKVNIPEKLKQSVDLPDTVYLEKVLEIFKRRFTHYDFDSVFPISSLNRRGSVFHIECYERLSDLRSMQTSHALKKLAQTISDQGITIPLDNVKEIEEWFLERKNQASLEAITLLNLSGCELKVIPPQIKFFKNIHTLNVDNNELCELPDEIEKLEELEYLSLANNNIQVLDLRRKPETPLIYVNVTRNPVMSIPHRPRFTYINLSY